MTPAGQSLLRTIRYAEGTAGPQGYRTQFGGGTFEDQSRHPDQVINKSGYSSTAAGAYQFLTPTWRETKSELGLSDFGPENQDIAALRLAQKRLAGIGGLETVSKEGISQKVSSALAPEWASFPTASGKSYYGQPVRGISELQKVYGQVNNQDYTQGEVTPQQNINPESRGTKGFDVSNNIRSELTKTLKSRIANQAFSKIFGGGDANTADAASDRLLALADSLEQDGSEDAFELAERMRTRALTMDKPTMADSATLGPSDIVNAVMSTYKKKAKADAFQPYVDRYSDNTNGAQLRQRAEMASLTKPGANKGIQITSASDTSGEPGFDYVVEGGKRGANYYSPFKAEVLKVTGGQNWSTDLTTNPDGPRGYGNNIELRLTLPNGEQSDVLIAHFDRVSKLKPGDVIQPGTLLGTQGRTGSTTGAHISMDFYKPGTNTADLAARDYVRDTISKGGSF